MKHLQLIKYLSFDYEKHSEWHEQLNNQALLSSDLKAFKPGFSWIPDIELNRTSWVCSQIAENDKSRDLV